MAAVSDVGAFTLAADFLILVAAVCIHPHNEFIQTNTIETVSMGTNRK
jgi:hypothetical protein